MSSPSCSICFDSFTKSLRKRTDCSYCNVPVCRPCLQTFLLTDTTIEPVCPSCRAGWDRTFLNTHLTPTFLNGPFKRFRENVLMEREKARFPETQEQAAAYKSAIVLVKPAELEVDKLKKAIRTLPSKKAWEIAFKTYHDAQRTSGLSWENYTKTPEGERLRTAHISASKTWEEETDALVQQIQTIRKPLKEAKRIVIHFGLVPVRRARARVAAGAGQPAQAQAKEPEAPKEPTYTHKCPTTDCEGFLNSKWTCSLCSVNVCKTCHEIKLEEHACNPDVVESVKAIKKEAKPCPKCTALISKIDGCDQMWCTQCQTAFSWRTGAIETHVVHNPHYFQWMRQNGTLPPVAGGGAMPFIPARNCGHYEITQRLVHATTIEGNAPAPHDLLRFQRLFGHLGITINKCREVLRKNADEEWRRQLRVRRMAQDLSEREWKTILQRKEKESHKEQSRLDILEMYTTAGMDILRQITAPHANVHNIRKQMAVLYDFTKKANETCAAVYKCVPLDLDITKIQL